jgi:hypothetical protein
VIAIREKKVRGAAPAESNRSMIVQDYCVPIGEPKLVFIDEPLAGPYHKQV